MNRDITTQFVNTLSIAPLETIVKGKAVSLHATEALEERRDIAPTHSRRRH
jgi:hypothetical protein